MDARKLIGYTKSYRYFIMARDIEAAGIPITYVLQGTNYFTVSVKQLNGKYFSKAKRKEGLAELERVWLEL